MAGWTQCIECPIGYSCATKNALPALIPIDETAILGQQTGSNCTDTQGNARSSGGT